MKRLLMIHRREDVKEIIPYALPSRRHRLYARLLFTPNDAADSRHVEYAITLPPLLRWYWQLMRDEGVTT